MSENRISKSKMQLIASLKQKKARKESGLFVAEGNKCVKDTFGSFRLRMLVVEAERREHYKDVVTSCCDAEIYWASPAEIKRMSSLSTPADILAVYEVPEQDRNSWSIGIEDRLTLLLDGIQDPGNLGTIIRAADWFGVHHIAASRSTADLYNSKTIQATMGAVSRVKMLYTDLVNLVTEYSDLPVYGTLLDGQNIYDTSLSNNGFLIFGSEGHGISPEMREVVSQSLLIPSYPPEETTSESLNVAVATAITLAEFRRRAMLK